MEFKDKLRSLRKSRGMTQEQLAAELDIPESTIRRYEVMEGTPKRERLEMIADYFNVTVDYLIGRSVEKTEEPNSQKEVAEKLLGYLASGLTDEEIRQRMDFFVDVMKLSDEQVDEFMSFVRWQLATKKEQSAAYRSEER